MFGAAAPAISEEDAANILGDALSFELNHGRLETARQKNKANNDLINSKLSEFASALCDDPTALTQEDLDSIPPIAEGFVDAVAPTDLFSAEKNQCLSRVYADLLDELTRNGHLNEAVVRNIMQPSPAAATAAAVPEAPPQAATPSAYIPHLHFWDCAPKLSDMAARACRGIALSQADAEGAASCNISIATYGPEDGTSILGVEQGLPDCERVLLYTWFGERGEDLAALNATAAKIRMKYNPPPQTGNIRGTPPIRRNPPPAPCTHMVTSETGGFSVPHPCQ